MNEDQDGKQQPTQHRKQAKDKGWPRSYKDYAEYLLDLHIQEAMAHIRHDNASFSLLLIEATEESLRARSIIITGTEGTTVCSVAGRLVSGPTSVNQSRQFPKT